MFLESISDRVGFEVVSAKGLVFSSGIFLASVSGMFVFPSSCHVYFLHSTAYSLPSKETAYE